MPRDRAFSPKHRPTRMMAALAGVRPADAGPADAGLAGAGLAGAGLAAGSGPSSGIGSIRRPGCVLLQPLPGDDDWMTLAGAFIQTEPPDSPFEPHDRANP